MAVSASAIAQIRPQPGPGDPRLQTVDYRPDQIVLLEAAAGYQVTVELAPDEQVQSVAVGDSAAWQVTANRAGNQLIVKPVQAGADTNMTVVTNTRRYLFDLDTLPSPSPTMAYTVQFRYPAVAAMMFPPFPGAVPPTAQTYKVTGARALMPTRISDDGVRTYIDWPADAALPAVYVLDETGRETLANGNMRSGLYVIDSVADRWIFRIDKRTARAERPRPPEGPR